MGQVYQAWDPQLQRWVALKVQLGASEAERFRREAELTGQLNHPNVLKLHGVHECPGGLVMVYELVEGAASLRAAWIGAPLADRIALLEQVAAGLSAAHEAGIVHRDLKPENILVDGEGRVRICDFGIAFRSGGDRLTQTGTMLGTPQFMAPEQFQRRADPTPAADVYSLGVLLYLALYDSLPFEHCESLMALAAARQSELNSKSLPASAPPALRVLCARCLRVDPSQRPATAHEFRQGLVGKSERAGGRNVLFLAGLLTTILVGVALGLPLALRSPQTAPGASSPSATLRPSLTAEAPSAKPSARVAPTRVRLERLDQEIEIPQGTASLEYLYETPQGALLGLTARTLLVPSGGESAKWSPQKFDGASFTPSGVHYLRRKSTIATGKVESLESLELLRVGGALSAMLCVGEDRLLTGDDEGKVVLRELPTLRVIKSWNLLAGQVRGIAALEEGLFVLFARLSDRKGAVRTLSLRDGPGTELGFPSVPRCLVGGAQGWALGAAEIVWVGDAQSSRFRPLTAGDSEDGFRRTHHGLVRGISLSPSGRYLASVSKGVEQGRELRVWDLATEKLLGEFGAPTGAFLNVVWTAKGEIVVATRTSLTRWRCVPALH
jgi:protein kinase-like protein